MDSIIFDVDGTLWDSTEVVAKAWNNYLQKEEHMNITFTADQLKAAPLYEDLEKALQILSAKYPLYIVSNSQCGYIELFLEKNGFGKYFRGHLCNGDTGLDKGSNIRQIADQNGLKSPVYIGDTMGDFEACRKAGVPFILAEYGFGKVPEPDMRISKPMDLITLFC